MSDEVFSPNMNLPIPAVGVTSGPQYATDINTSLLTIDGHNHSFGSGVPITPTGLNINTDLSIQSNNVTSVKTVRFTSQSTTIAGTSPNLGCLYEVLNDLYFNDGAGNQVRITQSGGVAGSPGSISNLTSPASAAYVSGTKTFVWQSGANTPANLDAGSVILRDILANSKGVTLNPPAALAADYSVTFPAALPGSQSFLAIDSSGNITAPLTILVGIDTANIANSAVTIPKMAAANLTSTSSSGSFTHTGTSGVQATNLSASLTVSGKPVSISFQPDGTSSTSSLGVDVGTGNFQIQRDGSLIALSSIIVDSGGTPISIPPSGINFIDTAPIAGSHTYALIINAVGAGTTVSVKNVVMVLREL